MKGRVGGGGVGGGGAGVSEFSSPMNQKKIIIKNSWGGVGGGRRGEGRGC